MSRSQPEYPEAVRPVAATPRSGDVLRSAVDLFVLASTHERTQIRAFADLVTGLLPDAEPADRVHAARRLAHRADTPPTVARLLATDAIEIAETVILRSPVLTSGDLVEIMRHGPAHVAAVAERLGLTSEVALALTRSNEIEAEMRDADRRAGGARANALPDLPPTARDLVEAVVGTRPFAGLDVEADVALQRALDELAAELEAEAVAHAAEAAAAKAVREADPTVPGDIDAFLDLDPAARWRIIQESSTAALLAASPRRRRTADPSLIGPRLFSALVAGENVRLGDDLAEAAELDRAVVERMLVDRHGEALAVALAALGIDERTATSILLLHGGERITLAHMQDLSAMAGRIGWRTAEHLLARWRGESATGRVETRRVLDPAERRGGARGEAAGVDQGRGETDLGRRRSGEG